LQFAAAQANPADATTYYFGSTPSVAMGSTAASQRVYIPKAGTITACYLFFNNNGTLGSSETSTVSIRLNNTTDTTCNASVTNAAVGTAFSGTGLSISVAAGDYLEMKWVAPTWVTNPTNVRPTAVLYIQ
jgi:hypothetical protein